MGVEQGGRSQIVKINWGGKGISVKFIFSFVSLSLRSFGKKRKTKEQKHGLKLKTREEKRRLLLICIKRTQCLNFSKGC